MLTVSRAPPDATYDRGDCKLRLRRARTRRCCTDFHLRVKRTCGRGVDIGACGHGTRHEYVPQDAPAR
jgi:hypothetical protein